MLWWEITVRWWLPIFFSDRAIVVPAVITIIAIVHVLWWPDRSGTSFNRAVVTAGLVRVRPVTVAPVRPIRVDCVA